MSVKVGQVLWMRFKFNNSGDVSQSVHPYLIVDVDTDNNVCEIAQLDSAEGKMHKVLMRTNKLVQCRNPLETAITKDGFAQLDNTYRVELHEGLDNFKRTEDVISKIRLEGIIKAYRKYHEENEIDEDKNVYLTYAELIRIQ